MPDLDPTNVRRGHDPEPSSTDGEHLDKHTLAEDRAKVVFSVQTYSANAVTKYGTGPDATLDVLVLTGRLKGRRDRQWRVYGNFAKQAGTQPPGQSTVAQVVSGPGQTPGSTWYGLDFGAISEEDVATARRALAWASGQEARQPTTAQPTTAPNQAPVTAPNQAPVTDNQPAPPF